jgi:hypothetical protein
MQNSLSVYQIVTPLISFCAMYYAWSLTFKQKKSVWESILWTLFWGFIAMIALIPDSLHYLTVLTGIKNSTNAVLVTTIGILAFIVFTIIIRLEELHQRHIALIRRDAILRATLHKKHPEESLDDI